MANNLTIAELIAEYKKADSEGKDLFKKVSSEKNYIRSTIATIKMNACTDVKNRLLFEIGKATIKGEVS